MARDRPLRAQRGRELHGGELGLGRAAMRDGEMRYDRVVLAAKRRVCGEAPHQRFGERDEGLRGLPAELVPCDDLGAPGDVDFPEDLPERFR